MIMRIVSQHRWCLSCSTNLRSTSGLIRNSSGNCLAAFCRFLGHTTVLEAELWGVLEGLQVVWQNDFEKIIVQIGSSEALQLLPPSTDSPFALVRSIVSPYSKPWCIEFQNILHEANVASDYIAKMPAPTDGSCFIFYSFPTNLLAIFHKDTNGPPYSRMKH
ncbi:uncharacterized protein LOC120145436 [Hibiscus syriacus]|uniref:uncharacterized protein LOC120145436 n=1 Tax=Hibiscus syriacus TaxID=106335 RepID=UPI0019223CEB|nr:uncharacterized protein LOC120145436 [Hibiscus syriacus]